MQASGRLALLAYNATAAVVGAAVMFALVRTVMLESANEPRDTPRIASTNRTPDSRLGFTPRRLSEAQQSEDPQLKPTIQPRADGTPAWSTETRSEAATPLVQQRFTLLPPLRLPWQSAKPAGPQRLHTVKTRLAEIGPGATVRLAAKFESAKAIWPPSEIVLIAIKDEKALELHARSSGSAWKKIHRYRVLAASGGAGPKLRQGDRQVPEGIYSIAFLNPNSAYHVSLRVNYPNAFDRQMAAKDARKDLGGDIMIHGKNLSAGCLAMGDEAVEELFVLAAQTGLSHVKLIIAPTDFRENGIPSLEAGRPEWLPKLYAEVSTAMAEFKEPASKGLLSFFSK